MNVRVLPFELLQKSIEFTSANHQAISENLAHVNTPGYRTKHVEFFDDLRRELTTSQPNLDGVETRTVETDGLPIQLNGNNVDVDQQLTNLEKNTLLHQTYSQLLAAKISIMRTAITGR